MILSLGAVVAVLFLLIQLIPVDRSDPPIVSEINVPADVRTVLRSSCYDCHSNETKWPWYSRIAPVAWLVASDVSEGRKELNFSKWGDYSVKKQTKKLKEIRLEINKGDMPPWNYLIIHKEAALSADDKNLLLQWALDSTPQPDSQ